MNGMYKTWSRSLHETMHGMNIKASRVLHQNKVSFRKGGTPRRRLVWRGVKTIVIFKLIPLFRNSGVGWVRIQGMIRVVRRKLWRRLKVHAVFYAGMGKSILGGIPLAEGHGFRVSL